MHGNTQFMFDYWANQGVLLLLLKISIVLLFAHISNLVNVNGTQANLSSANF